jgi:hypothetical protein
MMSFTETKCFAPHLLELQKSGKKEVLSPERGKYFITSEEKLKAKKIMEEHSSCSLNCCVCVCLEQSNYF